MEGEIYISSTFGSSKHFLFPDDIVSGKPLFPLKQLLSSQDYFFGEDGLIQKLQEWQGFRQQRMNYSTTP